MRILGIDPGLRLTGYGVIDVQAVGGPKLVDAGVIRLDGEASVPERLVDLEKGLISILDEHHPQVAAVEKLYAHYAHPTTAITMGHGRGVVLLALARRGVPIHELAANRVKQAITGHGHAHKDQMQRAIQALFRLKDLPKPPDVADALAIAVCCARQIDSLPATGQTRPESASDMPAPRASTAAKAVGTTASPAGRGRIAKRKGVGETAVRTP